MKILSVKLIREIEEDGPVQQQLGEYTDEAALWNICRCCGQYVSLLAVNHQSTLDHKVSKYFKPIAGDEEPGTELYQKYGLEDFKRMEAYNNGEWRFTGIHAEAQIKLSDGDLTQTIRSGSLWGIESDADADHVGMLEKDQLTILRNELQFIGFSVTEIDEAFKSVERKQPK